DAAHINMSASAVAPTNFALARGPSWARGCVSESFMAGFALSQTPIFQTNAGTPLFLPERTKFGHPGGEEVDGMRFNANAHGRLENALSFALALSPRENFHVAHVPLLDRFAWCSASVRRGRACACRERLHDHLETEKSRHRHQ